MQASGHDGCHEDDLPTNLYLLPGQNITIPRGRKKAFKVSYLLCQISLALVNFSQLHMN